ncbi:hypothetical protein TWF718_007827 [Orbilia javanica]|uniref:Uncharacterized protein n=1 Tax=Orbilia javanica TaxID=47235 RepID=A0AAN8MPH8_9PEZI
MISLNTFPVAALLTFHQPLLTPQQSASSSIEYCQSSSPENIVTDRSVSILPELSFGLDRRRSSGAGVDAVEALELFQTEPSGDTYFSALYPMIIITIPPEPSGANKTAEVPVPLLGLLAMSMYLMDFLMM